MKYLPYLVITLMIIFISFIVNHYIYGFETPLVSVEQNKQTKKNHPREKVVWSFPHLFLTEHLYSPASVLEGVCKVERW